MQKQSDSTLILRVLPVLTGVVLKKIIINFFILLISFSVFSSVSAEQMYSKAVDLYEKGDFQQASELLLFIVEEFPDNSWVDASYYLLGDCSLKMNNYIKAREYYSLIINRYSDSPLISDSYFFIGKTYEMEKNFEKMADYYFKFLANFPESYWIYDAQNTLKHVNLRDGRTSESIFYSIALEYHMKHMYDLAEEYYRIIINNFPSSPFINSSYYMLGEIYHDMHENDKAESLYSKVKKESEMYFKALYRIGDINFFRGNYEKATEIFQNIINTASSKHSNEIANSIYMYAETLLILNRTKEAEDVLVNFINRHTDSEWISKAQATLDKIQGKKPAEDYSITEDVKISAIQTKIEQNKLEKISALSERIRKKDTPVDEKKEVERRSFLAERKLETDAYQNYHDGFYFTAIKSFEELINNGNANTDIYYKLAVLYNQMHDPETALEMLQKYMDEGNVDSQVLSLQAYLLFKLNKKDHAISVFEQIYSKETDFIQKEEARLAVERLRLSF